MRKTHEVGQKAMHFNDPTAWAVTSLLLHVPYTQSMLESFLNTGGVRALLRVLQESRCLMTIDYALQFVGKILDGREAESMCWKLAEEFHDAGEQSTQSHCTV